MFWAPDIAQVLGCSTLLSGHCIYIDPATEAMGKALGM